MKIDVLTNCHRMETRNLVFSWFGQKPCFLRPILFFMWKVDISYIFHPPLFGSPNHPPLQKNLKKTWNFHIDVCYWYKNQIFSDIFCPLFGFSYHHNFFQCTLENKWKKNITNVVLEINHFIFEDVNLKINPFSGSSSINYRAYFYPDFN